MLKDVRFCAWGFLVSLLCIFGGGALGGSFLMLPTSLSAADLAAHYRHYHTQILWFTVVQTVGALLWLLIAAAITVVLMRMQPRSLVLSLIVLTSGVLQALTPFLGCVFFAAAAVQPKASPEVILSLHTTGRLIFLASLHSMVFGIAIAIAIFRDSSSLLPKWYAWLSIVYGVFTQFTVFSVFFKTGPISADGVLSLALPLVLVATFTIATSTVLLRIKPSKWVEADAVG